MSGSGAETLDYSRGEICIGIYQGKEKGQGSGNFGGSCGRRKRETQIELKTEEEYVTHTTV